jgi:hypothetical protein
VTSLIQNAKRVVLDYYSDLGATSFNGIGRALERHVAPDYSWRGVYPLGEGLDARRTQVEVYEPLRRAFPTRQWRQDIFFAGTNDASADPQVWTCSMGHLMGLFDQPWLGIAPTGRIASLRFAEFHQVVGDKIVQTAAFFDIIGLMQQAGCYPLPPSTGNYFAYPGPRTHDGLLLDERDPAEGAATMALVNRMVADLDHLNKTGEDRCPPEYLARTWHEDMVWYGPAGIGATMSITRYQQQHQYPFRQGLTDKVYNGHVARFAEGDYAGFFGWPNLTNRPVGGFLGLPASQTPGDMRIVDVYRRDGDKLAENWVLMDIPWYLKMQGLDIFERMRALDPIS